MFIINIANDFVKVFSVTGCHSNKMNFKINEQNNFHFSGLCGTYDFNQKNDFTTKMGDIETNTNAFGNRWKTVPTCRDVALNSSANPCDNNTNRKNQSSQYCAYLKSDFFQRKFCVDM